MIFVLRQPGQHLSSSRDASSNSARIYSGHVLGAATQRWILQQLLSKMVLAHISAFPKKCTIKHPFHTTPT
jgi:hypothetical protein